MQRLVYTRVLSRSADAPLMSMQLHYEKDFYQWLEHTADLVREVLIDETFLPES